MNATERAAAARALADSYDALAGLEQAAADAKAAYQADRTPENKAAHHAASAALNAARDEVRSSPVATTSTEPGSVTVSPAPAGKGGR